METDNPSRDAGRDIAQRHPRAKFGEIAPHRAR
jgi:hypothetical protein